MQCSALRQHNRKGTILPHPLTCAPGAADDLLATNIGDMDQIGMQVRFDLAPIR